MAQQQNSRLEIQDQNKTKQYLDFCLPPSPRGYGRTSRGNDNLFLTGHFSYEK